MTSNIAAIIIICGIGMVKMSVERKQVATVACCFVGEAF